MFDYKPTCNTFELKVDKNTDNVIGWKTNICLNLSHYIQFSR